MEGSKGRSGLREPACAESQRPWKGLGFSAGEEMSPFSWRAPDQKEQTGAWGSRLGESD